MKSFVASRSAFLGLLTFLVTTTLSIGDASAQSSPSSTNVISGTIRVPGERDVFQIIVPSSSRYYFDTLTAPSGIQWSLSGPPGSLVANRPIGSSDSFNISTPALDLPPGTYDLTVEGSAASTNAYSFRFLNLADSVPVTPGVVVTNQLIPSTETDFYQFNGTAGDQIQIKTLNISGAASTSLRIIDPFGRDFHFAGYSSTPVLNLTVSGVYVLLVEGSPSNIQTSSSYSFTLDLLGNTPPPPLTGSPIGFGTNIVLNLAIAETNQFLFSLPSASRITLDSLTNSASVTWTLIGPPGLIVTRSLDFGELPLLDVPAGNYQLTIRNNSGALRTAVFRMLNASQAPTINLDTFVQDLLIPGQAMKLYRFTGTAGTTIYFNTQPTNQPVNASFSIHSPFSTTALETIGITTDRSFVLPASGTYNLVLNGYLFDTAGAGFAFQLGTPQAITTPFTPGNTVTATFSEPGEQHSYTFSVSQPSKYYFDNLTNAPGVTVQLRRASGASIFQRGLNSSDWANISEPLLSLSPGDYEFRFSVNSDATPRYSFRLLDVANATPFTYGSETAVTLNPSSETKIYRFNGTAGERLYLRSLESTGIPNAQLRIFDPANELILGSSPSSSVGPFTLKRSGTHYLLVEGYIQESTASGSARFILDTVNDVSRSIAVGEVISDQITKPGQTRRYNLTLNTTTRLYPDVLNGQSGVVWTLDGPQGRVFSQRGILSTDWAHNSDLGFYKLGPGSYVLNVFDNSSNTNAYSFRLLNLDAAAFITLNSDISTNFPTARETVAYRLNVNAGQKIYFDTLNRTGVGNLQWRLVDPRDSKVFLQGFFDQDTLTLGMTGTYLLLLEGYPQETGSGSVSFRLHSVIDGTPSLSFGSVITGTISTPGQQQRYTFNLASDSKLYFDSLTNRSQIRWSLTGLTGNLISNRSFSSSDAQNAVALLNLAAGTYTLTVFADAENTGGYAFQILDGATAPFINPGTSVFATNNPAIQTRIYRLNATVGDRFRLGMTNVVTMPNSGWRVVDPFGKVSNFTGNSSGFDPYNATATGTYLILVEGYIGETGAGSFRFVVNLEANTPPNFTGTPISLGSTINGNIPNLSTTNRYVLTLASERRVVMDAISNVDLQWSLTGPPGDLVINRPFSSSDGNSFSDGDLLLPAGTYLLTVRNPANTSVDFSFRLLDFAAATPVSFGVLTTNTLSPNRITTLYRFTAAADTKVFFDTFTPTGFNNQPSIKIYDPKGRRISYLGSFTDSGVLSALYSGDYTVLIEGQIYDPNTNGTYRFKVNQVVDTTDNLVLGAKVQFENTTPGQARTYRFSLPAPKRLFMDIITVEPNSTFSWSLKNQFNELLVNNRNIVSSDSADIADASLALDSGDYELTFSPSNDNIGTIAFRLLDATVAPVLVPGTAVTNSLTPASLTALYQFNGTAGARFYYDGNPYSGFTHGPYTRLYTPSGTLLINNGSQSEIDNITLPTTGTYVLSVEGRNFDPSASGTFSFNLRPVVYSTNTLTIGSIVSGRINAAGEQVYYRFSIPTTTTVIFDSLLNVSLLWDLTGPEGTLVSGKNLSSSDSYEANDGLVTLAPGNYLMTIRSAGSSIGDFAFRWLDVINAQPFLPDTLVQKDFTPASGTILLTFDAAEGDRFYYDGRPVPSGRSVSRVRFFAPDKTVFKDVGSASDIDNFAIPITGSYLVAVEGRASDAAPTNTVEFVLYSIPPQNPVVIGGSNPPPDLIITSVRVPANGNPGQAVPISWTIRNQGAGPATGVWSDQLFLSDNNSIGNDDFLASISLTATLAAGQELSRTQFVTLPSFASGSQYIVVAADGANRIPESSESNNAGISSTPIQIPVALALTLSPVSVIEGSPSSTVSGFVLRNSSLGNALNVSLSSDAAGRVSFPSTVTIPAGRPSAAFTIQVLDNSLTESNVLVTFQATAPSHTVAQAGLTIIENDLPELSVSLNTNRLSEAAAPGTLLGSVTRNANLSQPLTVNLLSDRLSTITVPQTVIIPANQTSATFVPALVNNSTVEGERRVNFTVSAPGYPAAGAFVFVTDDDSVSLGLTLSQSSLTEGAPNPAAVLTVRRTPVTSASQRLRLASDNPLLSFITEVTIPADQAELKVNINVGDDDRVTGPRAASINVNALTIDGFIIPGATATLPITILDNDGPKLTVTADASVISEGSSTTVSVRRNVPSTNDVTVLLNAAPSGQISIPPSVVLLKGQDVVSFVVQGVADGVSDGLKTVTISATAGFFNPGSTELAVTDIDIPDLTVADIIHPASVLTDALLEMSFTITNSGLASANGTWVDRVFLATDAQGGGSTLVSTTTNANALAEGDSYTATRKFLAPSVPGTYWLVVTTDATNTVTEASERNNTIISSDAVQIAPAYRATVSTDIDSAISGVPIPLKGKTFFTIGGAPAPNRTATIRIRVGDVRRIIQVTSDSNGDFTANFQPIPGEAGVYLIGADHPRVTEDPTQDQFTLLGMRATPIGLNLSLAPSNTLSGTIEIRNLSPLPLSGLQVATVSAPPQFIVNAQLPAQLAGNQVVTLSYDVTTTLSSRAQGSFRLRITSAQGAQLDIPVNFILNPPAPQLIALPSSLQRGMLRGAQSLVSFTVVNQGGAHSGDLNVVLPVVPWMSLVTTSTIPSLAPGATNTVVLALNPASNLPLTRYDGSLALVSSVASLNVPFQFRAISDALGDLKIFVSDENTYYVTNSPKVTNAFVQVRDPIGGNIVAQGNTDSNGEILFTNLREGDYEVVASAPKHSGNQGIVRLVPGVTTTQEVFLTRQSVTYQWTVVPTEYEDRYRVILEPQFETEVPYPNLIIENPQIIPLVIAGRTSQFEVRYRNNGLVALRQIKVQVPQGGRYIIKPLVDVIDELPAQSTLTVPFTIRLSDNPTLAADPGCDNCVVQLPIDTTGFFRCGQNFVTVAKSVTVEPLCIPDTGCFFDSPDVTRFDFGTASQISFDAQFDCLAGKLNECQKARIRGYLKHGDFGYVSGPFGDGISDFCGCTDEPHIPAMLDFAKDYLETLGFSFPPGSNLSTVPALISGFTVPGPCNFPAPSLSDAVGSASSSTGPQLAAQDTPKPAADSTEKAVCAKVRIQISQDITLTRTAFRGTLTINNDSPDAITGIKVDLDFRDPADQSTGDRFVITGPTLTGLSAVDGSGSIASNGSATAEYLFYPKLEAAATGPAVYRIGGSLRYIEGGQEVVLPLTTVPITVLPEARLELEYFQQRDVYSDDPFTTIIEPAEPFSLGLRIKNVGAGDARKFKIASGQPKIIENEKGLLIDFKLLGTQLGDKEIQPAFEVAVGDIPSGQSKVVIWNLTSSLQGKFIDYRASFEHVNALGGVNLSLIQKVILHEMIHVVRAARPTDDTLPDFLVNDTPDPDNLPDVVYLSDGTTVPVAVGTGTFDGQVSDGDLEVQLTVSATPGWMYFRLPNPGPDYRLTRVLRADGTAIRLADNAWTTDRSFPSAIPGAVREKLVHLFDYNPTGTYRLQYGIVADDTNAPVSQVTALPTASPTTFAVQWSGSDNAGGSGIASFDIYVSANGGPFTNWLAGTSLTSALFPGTFGSTYAFYSRARDTAGNLEAAPANPDATTKVEISANRPPVITSIAPQSVDEGEAAVFTVSGSDPDLPAQTVTYSLTSTAPSGALIDPNSGIFRWTTSETDGGRVFNFGVIGTDNGSPSLSITQAVSVTVRELNAAPIITPPSIALSANEGSLFSYTFTATDSDQPLNTFQWRLGGNPPSGMSLGLTTGTLSWNPPESAGPGQVNFSVTVTDNGNPARSDTKNFTLTVNEVNRSPILDPISDGNIAALEIYSAVVSASDPDLPAQSLVYSLAPGAPRGAGINRRTGQLIFRSSRDTAGRTNLITVRVTDTGTPPLSDSKTVKVVVGDYFELGLGQTSLRAGTTSSVPISVYNTFASQGGSCEVSLPTSRFSQVSVKPAVGGSANLTLTSLGGGLYRITVQSTPVTLPSGTTVLGDLIFTAVAGQTSGTLSIPVTKVTGLRANGSAVTSAYGSDGRVVVVGTQPVLEAARTRLLLYGNPGQSYRVESSSTLNEPIGWTPYWTGTLTEVQQSLPLPPAGQTRFFRAVQ